MPSAYDSKFARNRRERAKPKPGAPQTRSELFKVLSEELSMGDTNALLGRLRNPDLQGNPDMKRAVKRFLLEAAHGSDVALKINSLPVLARMYADEHARKAVLQATGDKNTGVRIRAVMELHNLPKDKEVLDVALAASHDGNPIIRISAIGALFGFHNPRSLRRITELCEDTDEGVRKMALGILAERKKRGRLYGAWDGLKGLWTKLVG